jgi:hypothetical protein
MLKTGNIFEKRTLTTDLATVGGIVTGAVVKDLVSKIPFVVKQDPNLTDGAFTAVGLGAGMIIKSTDPLSTFIKYVGFAIGASSALSLVYRNVYNPKEVVTGQNGFFKKHFGMNSMQVGSSTPRPTQIAQGMRYQNLATRVNVFDGARVAQG